MTCPNCKCYVINSWKRCEYCGTFLDTGKTTTVNISDYYNARQNNTRTKQYNDYSGYLNYNQNINYSQDDSSNYEEYYEYHPSNNVVCALLLAIIVLVLFILLLVII